MVNLAVHLGSVGLTLSLFIISFALLLDDNATWQSFFVFGVYLTTWNTVWGVVRSITGQLMEAVRKAQSATDYLLGTLSVYAVAIGISVLVTWAVGGWLLGAISDPKWDILSTNA